MENLVFKKSSTTFFLSSVVNARSWGTRRKDVKPAAALAKDKTRPKGHKNMAKSAPAAAGKSYPASLL